MKASFFACSFACLLVLGASAPVVAQPSRVRELVGKPAPGWGDELRWFGERGPSWAKLRGKVVVVRWWTGPDCGYCKSTAPVLKRFARRYGERGLVVVGMFHPKPRPRPVPDDEVKARVEEKGFGFPIAVDADWALLRKWWLGKRERGWTSVTFLVDKKGVVRYVHPGGEFHEESGRHTKGRPIAECAADYRQIERTIEQLLDE